MWLRRRVWRCHPAADVARLGGLGGTFPMQRRTSGSTLRSPIIIKAKSPFRPFLETRVPPCFGKGSQLTDSGMSAVAPQRRRTAPYCQHIPIHYSLGIPTCFLSLYPGGGAVARLLSTQAADRGRDEFRPSASPLRMQPASALEPAGPLHTWSLSVEC